MGKAYSEQQKLRVKALLEAGRDEEEIEKETGVTDRTIRRWKSDLERTGRIGKPPESRTGRHRVLSADVQAALVEHVKAHPDLSVDDMLWWLYDTYEIVVGTRTIRRVFERKDDKGKLKGKAVARHVEEPERGEKGLPGAEDDDEEEDGVQDSSLSLQNNEQYQSPYPVMPLVQPTTTEQELVQALQQHSAQHTFQTPMEIDAELPEDEETIQLQLQQIALQKRELELKLRMRRLQTGKGAPSIPRTPTVSTSHTESSSNSGIVATEPAPSAPSSLYNPNASVGPTLPKRDSRSKKKIQESKRRTAERQERMLRDLERRSRRRDHLTAEWVLSKDIWPLRAQGLLADLMHQYCYYAFSHTSIESFEVLFHDLYQLVDLSKGDWAPHVHDDLLRERTKRKMGQLRAKMLKTGEILPRSDGYPGFVKAIDFTGQHAGADIMPDAAADMDNDADPELSSSVVHQALPPLAPATIEQMQVHAQNGAHVLQQQEDQQQQQQQQQDQHHQHHNHHLPQQHGQYEPVPDPLHTPNLPYAHHHHPHHLPQHQHHPSLLDAEASNQYPLLNPHHPAMLSYVVDEEPGTLVM